MSLVVILCEDRFREELELLAQQSGYHLLNRRPESPSATDLVQRLLPAFPDLAAVVSDAGGQEWVEAFDRTNLRYWLVKIGAPRKEGFREPTREPHRRLLSVNPSSAAYLRQLLDDWCDREMVRVDCFTFGYRHGLPAEADWVVDTRFLDSPYWIPEMRELSGRDPLVRRHMMAQGGAQQLVESFLPMLLQLLPLYQTQRRSVLRIAVGCTGGKHRSVAIAAELVDRINQSGVAHARHIDQPPLSVPQSLD
ncbi:MAG: RapZ C-terminal domain-containing protein [Candidatus Dormibacteria bacterium]